MNTSKRILSIETKRIIDESPGTSFIGQFGRQADTQFAIEHRGAHSLPWFNPGSVESFNPSASWIPAEVQGESARRQYWHAIMTKNAKQDHLRMCQLIDGEFHFIGVQATAEVTVGGVCQTLTSGGLWGIESDSEESYFAEIEAEQLSELRGILAEIDFSKRAIATAVNEAQNG